MKGYFITGTGTGVGKTFVAVALSRCAVDLKHRVFAFKPIETGCREVDGSLLGDDQELLCAAAGNWQTGSLRGVYRFRKPAAPSVAARAEGCTLDPELVLRTFESGKAQASFAIVEGAGGWRVPITEHLDMAGLARLIGLEVIVVGSATLGTINHTLLTVESVKQSGQTVAAVVISEHPKDSVESSVSNIEQIQERIEETVIRFRGSAAELTPLFEHM